MFENTVDAVFKLEARVSFDWATNAGRCGTMAGFAGFTANRRSSYWLDYLLRRHKGHFYRKRYPPLSVM